MNSDDQQKSFAQHWRKIFLFTVKRIFTADTALFMTSENVHEISLKYC